MPIERQRDLNNAYATIFTATIAFLSGTDGSLSLSATLVTLNLTPATVAENLCRI